ncbi:hypothetical protein TNCV_5062671 [Trichonephila clavipes]|nr:hypothetical protein TNCV_5062671 [Trichonephila clavipes]
MMFVVGEGGHELLHKKRNAEVSFKKLGLKNPHLFPSPHSIDSSGSQLQNARGCFHLFVCRTPLQGVRLTSHFSFIHLVRLSLLLDRKSSNHRASLVILNVTRTTPELALPLPLTASTPNQREDV